MSEGTTGSHFYHRVTLLPALEIGPQTTRGREHM